MEIILIINEKLEYKKKKKQYYSRILKTKIKGCAKLKSESLQK